MGEIHLEDLHRTLCKGVRMIVAVRMLARDVELDAPELAELEREVRERAGEVGKALKSALEDNKRPLLEY